MGAGDLAPNDSELRAGLGDLCLVNVSNTLAQIELGGISVRHTINVHKIGVDVRVASSSVCLTKMKWKCQTTMIKLRSIFNQPLVAQDGTLHIQPHGLNNRGDKL